MQAVTQKVTFMKKVRWLGASPTIVAVAGSLLSFFAVSAVLDANQPSVAAPASQLIYDFVAPEVEAELSCDFFKQCLHIEIVDTAQCSNSILIEMGFRDLFGRPMSDEDIVVASPKYSGGFVVEIGSNMRAEIGTFGIVRVSCSHSAPSVLGAS